LQTRLSLLIVTQTEQDNVTGIDPDFLSQLSADVAETFLAIEALRP
jgi:hypothetical protein